MGKKKPNKKQASKQESTEPAKEEQKPSPEEELKQVVAPAKEE